MHRKCSLSELQDCKFDEILKGIISIYEIRLNKKKNEKNEKLSSLYNEYDENLKNIKKKLTIS